MVRHPALLSGLIALALATPANAEVTRFKVLERTASALQGRGFGAAGQVEKITASATIALDPANPSNAVIIDLDRAPRNADGKAEATSDVVILRPEQNVADTKLAPDMAGPIQSREGQPSQAGHPDRGRGAKTNRSG